MGSLLCCCGGGAEEAPERRPLLDGGGSINAAPVAAGDGAAEPWPRPALSAEASKSKSGAAVAAVQPASAASPSGADGGTPDAGAGTDAAGADASSAAPVVLSNEELRAARSLQARWRGRTARKLHNFYTVTFGEGDMGLELHTDGLVVYGSVPDSQASSLGVQDGSRIVSVNGHYPSNYLELAAIYENHNRYCFSIHV